MPHPGGRPLKFSTPEELYNKGCDYIDKCIEKTKPITITGLALALDTSRETLMNYEERPEFFDTVKRLKLYCENYAEEMLYLGKNAAGPIFALKNFGWKDKSESDITTKGESINPVLVKFIDGKNN